MSVHTIRPPCTIAHFASLHPFHCQWTASNARLERPVRDSLTAETTSGQLGFHQDYPWAVSQAAQGALGCHRGHRGRLPLLFRRGGLSSRRLLCGGLRIGHKYLQSLQKLPSCPRDAVGAHCRRARGLQAGWPGALSPVRARRHFLLPTRWCACGR